MVGVLHSIRNMHSFADNIFFYSRVIAEIFLLCFSLQCSPVVRGGQSVVRGITPCHGMPPIIVYLLQSPPSSSRYFELVFYKNGLTESNPNSLHFALAWQLIQRIMKSLVWLSFFFVLSVLRVRGGVRWRRSLFDIIPGVAPGSALDSGNHNHNPQSGPC